MFSKHISLGGMLRHSPNHGTQRLPNDDGDDDDDDDDIIRINITPCLSCYIEIVRAYS